VFQSSPEQTVGSVASAITHRYRLIDTGAAYLNELQKRFSFAIPD